MNKTPSIDENFVLSPITLISSLPQLLKLPDPILMIVEGRVIEVRDEQPEKQLLPRDLTPSGIVTEVRAEQL